MIHQYSEEPIGDWRKIFQLTFPTSVVLGVKATRTSFFLLTSIPCSLQQYLWKRIGVLNERVFFFELGKMSTKVASYQARLYAFEHGCCESSLTVSQ